MATSKWYANGLKNITSGLCGWATTYNITCALLTNDYTPNEDTDEIWTDVSSYEVTDAEYAQVEITVTPPSYVAETKTIFYSCTEDEIVWGDPTAVTFDARYLVVYADTGTDATDFLIGYVDFGEIKSVVASTFTFTFDENGLFSLRRE